MSSGSCSGARACLCGQRLGFKRAPSKQHAIWSSGFYCATLFSLRSHQIEILSTAFSTSIPLTFFWVVHVYVTEWHNVKMWLQCFRTQACSRQPCTKCRFSALTSVNRTLYCLSKKYEASFNWDMAKSSNWCSSYCIGLTFRRSRVCTGFCDWLIWRRGLTAN